MVPESGSRGAQQEVGDRGLARSAAPDQGDRLVGLEGNADILQSGRIRAGVREGDIPEFDVYGLARLRSGVATFTGAHGRFLVEKFHHFRGHFTAQRAGEEKLANQQQRAAELQAEQHHGNHFTRRHETAGPAVQRHGHRNSCREQGKAQFEKYKLKLGNGQELHGQTALNLIALLHLLAAPQALVEHLQRAHALDGIQVLGTVAVLDLFVLLADAPETARRGAHKQWCQRDARQGPQTHHPVNREHRRAEKDGNRDRDPDLHEVDAKVVIEVLDALGRGVGHFAGAPLAEQPRPQRDDLLVDLVANIELGFAGGPELAGAEHPGETRLDQHEEREDP